MALMPAPLDAQVGTSAYNSLGLFWTAPGDDGNEGQVGSYQLRYDTVPVGADTASWWDNVPAAQRLTLTSPLAPAGAIDSTRVTDLAPGTTYHFVIRALDEAWNISGFSNVATGATLACTTPASAPSSFDAAADTGEVLATWDPIQDPAATALHLYRSTGTGGSWSLLIALPVSATSYLDTAVGAGTTYRYRAALMGTGCEGPSTGVVTVTLPGQPTPPAAAPASASVRIYPNPASGPVSLVIRIDGGRTLDARLRLYDLTGRWIATLADGSYPPGETQVTYNRTDRIGRPAAPGYYEVLGTIGSIRIRERLVLVP